MTALAEILLPSLLTVLLLGAIFSLVTGLGLLVNAQATLGFFARMNRWVITRVEQKAREEPVAPRPTALQVPRRRVVGSVFAIGGALAALLIGSSLNVPATALVSKSAPLAAMLVDVLRWFVLAGCVAALILGVALLFSPDIWAR